MKQIVGSPELFFCPISQSLETAQAEQEAVSARREEEVRRMVVEGRCTVPIRHLAWTVAGPLQVVSSQKIY